MHCGAHTWTGTCCRPYPAQTLALRCHLASACVPFWQALPRSHISSRLWAQHPQASCCMSKTRRPMQHWAWRYYPERWVVMQTATHAAAEGVPECSPRLMPGCRASCSCTWPAAGHPSFERRLSCRALLATDCFQRKPKCIPGTRRDSLHLLCRGCCCQLSRLHCAIPEVRDTTQLSPPGRRYTNAP